MPGFVICFAGQIGSGKSSVTRCLATALEWPRAAFGDYVRAELARRGGDPTSRDALQDPGQELVDADPHSFCAAVLASADFKPGGNLLLDGVRHIAIQRIVSDLARPSVTKLLYLAVGEQERRKRIASRAAEGATFARASAHRVEADLNTSLPAIADRSIDAPGPLAQVVSDCLEALRELGVDPAPIADAGGRLDTATSGA
jgi:adenylate kinase family enzyme